uniref:Putative secreted protein n=1 Tax=Amblyomma triste TaxID=251400 RepID=A0A023G3K3_AMBTT
MIKLKITAIILFITTWLCTESCYNNQRLGFCPRSRKVYQRMCQGVPAWPCNYVELVCGCVRGTFRSKDGKCVKEEACGITDKATVQDGAHESIDKDEIGHPEETLEDESPSAPSIETAEATPEATEPRYYISSTKGCQDAQECEASCKNLGYKHGNCDTYPPWACYCSGRIPRAKQEGLTTRNGKYSLYWPYGLITATGDLIQQLRGSYMCEREEVCSEACKEIDVEAVFCERSKCFCEASLPAGNWDYGPEYKDHVNEKELLPCDSAHHCELLCTGNEKSGGFCQGDPPICYCYNMYPYNQPGAETIAVFVQRVKAQSLKRQLEEILQSPQQVTLVQISTAAWEPTLCHCLSFASLSEQSSNSRLATCHFLSQLKKENFTTLMNRRK